MEDVIYGVMLNANTDREVKEPPVMALKKPNASLDWFAKKFAKEVRFYSRNRQFRTKADYHQHHEGEDQLLSDLLYLPCITECL